MLCFIVLRLDATLCADDAKVEHLEQALRMWLAYRVPRCHSASIRTLPRSVRDDSHISYRARDDDVLVK